MQRRRKAFARLTLDGGVQSHIRTRTGEQHCTTNRATTYSELSSGQCSAPVKFEDLCLRSNFLTAAAIARWNHGRRLVTA